MSQSTQQGFTLLEILIAIVILAIGILGMSGMQGTALYNNHSAQMRSKAMVLAHDMAERMRANRATALAAASNYKIDYTDFSSEPTAPSTNCDTETCTADEITAFDKYQWMDAVYNGLPLGKGSVAVNTGQRLATITIKWEDRHDKFHTTTIEPFVLEAQL
jgi:type IV pilus assembly protein PilV